MRGLATRRLHCLLKMCLETNLLYLLLPNNLDSLPLRLPVKNSNCLLLIVTVPSRRRIACQEEAGGTSHRHYWTSLKTAALRLRRASVRPLGAALGWPPQPTWYLLDHASHVRPWWRRPVFVDRGDTRWDFLGVGPHRLQSLPCYADRSRESGGCFFSGIKDVFMETGDAMISSAPPRVGMMRCPIYTPSCSTRTMAVSPLTTPRSGTWGGSRAVVVRHWDSWATRDVCLCVRRMRVQSTTRHGAFGVNRYRLRHMCATINCVQATAAAATWIKDGLEFLYFAPKTVGSVVRWWSSNGVLE
jgi:hypothetical protein